MIYMYLENFRCHEETDDGGAADEPYMVVVSIDLNAVPTIPGGPAIPASRAFVYGSFSNVDNKETHAVPFQAFWGLAGEERALPNPEDAIFLAAIMEWDDGDAHMLRGVVAAQVAAALVASINVTDRAERVRLTSQAFDSALRTPTGFPNLDDRVGGVQEIRFSRADITTAETGNTARQSLNYRGDGGNYTLTFAARNRGQAAWRFCSKCRSLFFDGYPDKGACPHGGGHVAAGWTYYLPHDHAGPLGGQNSWRFCAKCCAMFWAGDPNNFGTCRASGTHAPAGYDFFIPHDHAGPGQEQWRFCEKCRAMFWNGEVNKGLCAAGGGHSAQGFNFKLDFTP